MAFQETRKISQLPRDLDDILKSVPKNHHVYKAQLCIDTFQTADGNIKKDVRLELGIEWFVNEMEMDGTHVYYF